jgi:hypothetical protein
MVVCLACYNSFAPKGSSLHVENGAISDTADLLGNGPRIMIIYVTRYEGAATATAAVGNTNDGNNNSAVNSDEQNEYGGPDYTSP